MMVDEGNVSANQTTAVAAALIQEASLSVSTTTFSAPSLYCQQHRAKAAILGISWKKYDVYGDLLVDKRVFRQH